MFELGIDLKMVFKKPPTNTQIEHSRSYLYGSFSPLEISSAVCLQIIRSSAPNKILSNTKL